MQLCLNEMLIYVWNGLRLERRSNLDSSIQFAVVMMVSANYLVYLLVVISTFYFKCSILCDNHQDS